jgi:hypothetical protein
MFDNSRNPGELSRGVFVLLGPRGSPGFRRNRLSKTLSCLRAAIKVAMVLSVTDATVAEFRRHQQEAKYVIRCILRLDRALCR